MTVKEFFKSNAFKSLAVLIAIVLVAGALLAIFNDILYISTRSGSTAPSPKFTGRASRRSPWRSPRRTPRTNTER